MRVLIKFKNLDTSIFLCYAFYSQNLEEIEMATEKELLKNIRKTRAKVARMKEEIPKLEEQIGEWQDNLHAMLLKSERYKKQSAESVQVFVKSLNIPKNMSSRILNVFSRLEIKTMGDFVGCISESTLSRTAGLGEKGCGIIKVALEKRSLYLSPFGRKWNEPSRRQ